jgi:hypothetical protein
VFRLPSTSQSANLRDFLTKIFALDFLFYPSNYQSANDRDFLTNILKFYSETSSPATLHSANHGRFLTKIFGKIVF